METGRRPSQSHLSHNFLLPSAPFPKHTIAYSQHKHPGALGKWLEHSWEFICSSGISCHRSAFSWQKFAHLKCQVLGTCRLLRRRSQYWLTNDIEKDNFLTTMLEISLEDILILCLWVPSYFCFLEVEDMVSAFLRQHILLDAQMQKTSWDVFESPRHRP